MPSMFQGLTFHITPSVYPSVDGLQKIVDSAGGTLSTKKRPKAKTIETLVDDQVLHEPHHEKTCFRDF